MASVLKNDMLATI